MDARNAFGTLMLVWLVAMLMATGTITYAAVNPIYSPTSTYNITWVNRTDLSTSVLTAVPVGVNVTVLPVGYFKLPVRLGFDFPFCGQRFSVASLSPNGLFQFASSLMPDNIPPTPFPTATLQYAPFLTFMWSAQTLYSYDVDSRQYFTINNNAGRVFIFQISLGRYAYNATSRLVAEMRLYEQDGRIEIAFDRLDDFQARPVVMGIQCSSIDYALVYNSTLVNSMLTSDMMRNIITYQYNNHVTLQPRERTPYSRSQFFSIPEFAPLPNSTVLPLVDDQLSVSIALPFSFSFFGELYTHITISDNANIQFYTRSQAFSTTPMPLGALDTVPIIAVAFADLVPRNDSSLSYSVSGAHPNMIFTVRFQKLYYTITSGTISVDCALSEDGTIRMYYYRIDPTYQSMLIGIEGTPHPDGSSEYSVYWNNNPIPSSVANSLQGTTLQFSPMIAQPYTPNGLFKSEITPFYQGTYNATILAIPQAFSNFSNPVNITVGANVDAGTVPIGFTFIFFGKAYDTLYVDTGSASIQFESGIVNNIGGVMPFSNLNSLPFISIIYGDINDGNSAVSPGQVSYQQVGVSPNRELHIRFLNMPWAYQQVTGYATRISADVLLFENDGHIEIRYWKLEGGSDTALIGIQGVTVNGVYDFAVALNAAVVTEGITNALTQKMVVFRAINGKSVIKPRPETAPMSYIVFHNTTVASPIPFSTFTTNITSTADNTFSTANIGFNFTFYNKVYSSVVVSSNGLFMFSASSSDSTPQAAPYGNTNLLPFFAPYFCDLIPISSPSRAYVTLGQAPNRVFVFTFFNNSYSGFVSSGVQFTPIHFEVHLFETTNRIEVRYHAIQLVPSSSLNLLVAMQSDTRLANGEWDYVVWNNALPITDSITRNLHGTTLAFTPSPASPSSSSDDDLSDGAIAGIVIGVFFFVVLLLLVIFFVYKRQSKPVSNTDIGFQKRKSIELPSESRPEF